MNKPTAMTYWTRSPIDWVRRAVEGIDEELAGLCRQHWQKPRELSRVVVVAERRASLPEAAPVSRYR
jgi:hypothetical protein